MLQQRSLYTITPTPLIQLIISEPIFGSLKRETNRIFSANSVLNKLALLYFPDLTFTDICTSLSDFHQKQFVTYIANYRLLHYSLSQSTCPSIIFEHCYSLIQNLCILVESHLKEQKTSPNLLWNLLTQNINEPFKSILTSRLTLKSRFNTFDISTFNTHFEPIILEFETTNDPEEIICYCLYITYMCRNQVLHNITSGAKFHGNGDLTEKLIGILISAVHFVSKV
jgi:hypothetical protein